MILTLRDVIGLVIIGVTIGAFGMLAILVHFIKTETDEIIKNGRR